MTAPRAAMTPITDPRPPSSLIHRADPNAPTHRERLLEAMAEAIRDHGYRATTVAEVVRLARTSRRTFYENFEDRDDCFLQLFDAMNEVLSEKIAAALVPGSPWDEQVDQAVGAYIDEVGQEPEIAVACTREIVALGEAGARRQRDETEKFADLLMALVAVVGEETPGVTPMQKPTAIMITAGLRELVSYAIDHGTAAAELKATAAGVIKAVLNPDQARAPGG